MSALKKIALANMLLMSMLPEKAEGKIIREEKKAKKQTDVRKHEIVTYCTDENGQIKRKKEYSEENGDE